MPNRIAGAAAEAYFSESDFVFTREPEATFLTTLTSKEISIGKARATLETTSDRIPDWTIQVVERLNRIASLPANWDSYGARPVAQSIIQYALSVLLKVKGYNVPVPDIRATSRGGIEFEWVSGRQELLVRFSAPLQGSLYYLNENTGEEVETRFNIDYSVISDRLTAMFH